MYQFSTSMVWYIQYVMVPTGKANLSIENDYCEQNEAERTGHHGITIKIQDVISCKSFCLVLLCRNNHTWEIHAEGLVHGIHTELLFQNLKLSLKQVLTSKKGIKGDLDN